ncbi:hypothetical protein Q1695_008574 [Nippostrongylus brasiliensis]|nr:hypothetical protein Q1695_008574 [Nippostrongylus brasiliensis]
MATNEDTWKVERVRSLAVGCVAFDPTNTIVAACAGSDCILYSTMDGSRMDILEHPEEIVSAFFMDQYKLVTVGRCGDITEWSKFGEQFQQESSHKVVAFPVITAFYRPEYEHFMLVVDRATAITVDTVMRDKSLVTVASLPAGLKREQIAVTSSYVAYCSGKEVFVVPIEEDSEITASSYCCKSHIEGIGERNAANVFVRITALGDTIAATLAIGRVYIWSHVSRKGLHESAFTIHWHKVAPSLVLTQFGGLFSAGAEAVLCKFTLSGAGRPSMLPRLPAPARDLAISADSSHIAVISEDNSVQIVLTASMTVLSMLKTVVACERSLNTVFTVDPYLPGTVVMNGKPGSLQWIDCVNSITDQQVCFSLDNVADGDMSFAGITQTFPDVEQVFFTESTIVTLERIVNFEEDHKRLRFWERRRGTSLSVQVLESFIVSKDTVAITGPTKSSNDGDMVILSIVSAGMVSVWIPCENGKRFKLDQSRKIDKQYPFHAGSKVHRSMWASAYPEGSNNTDVVVVWNTSDMSEIETMRTDGRVNSVEFDERGHLVCGTDKSVRCWRHVAMRFELMWVVEQPYKVHVSLLGAFAFNNNTVVQFDEETSALKSSCSLPSSIIDLVAIGDEDTVNCLVARSEKGLFCVQPGSLAKKSVTSSSSTAKTPFALLAPVEASSQRVAEASFRPAAKAAAIRLLDGPCHALPPISLIAPQFIARCLAPPLK